MYPLFESIRVENGIIMHPSWHLMRYLDSYTTYYGYEPANGLFDGLIVPEACHAGTFKLRISYNHNSRKATWEPYTIRDITSLRLIEANDIDYSLKYTDRSHLNRLFKQKKDCDDILIIRHSLITDSSYCNIVLFNGEEWHTPAGPLLCGTARQRLLASGQVIARDISVDDLRSYECFKLINAMRDFETLPSIAVDFIRIDDEC